jgi:hypothetical protein
MRTSMDSTVVDKPALPCPHGVPINPLRVKDTLWLRHNIITTRIYTVRWCRADSVDLLHFKTLHNMPFLLQSQRAQCPNYRPYHHTIQHTITPTVKTPRQGAERMLLASELHILESCLMSWKTWTNRCQQKWLELALLLGKSH